MLGFIERQGLYWLGAEENPTPSGIKISVTTYHLTYSELDTLHARFGTAHLIFDNVNRLPARCTTCQF